MGKKIYSANLHQTEIIERVIKKDPDDKKRNRRLCIHYHKEDDGYCDEKYHKCYGSTNCRYYQEKEIIADINIVETKSNYNKKSNSDYKVLNVNRENKIATYFFIYLNSQKYKTLKIKLESRSKCFIVIDLNDLHQFENYDKYRIDKIFFDVNDKLIECVYDPSSLVVNKKGDTLSIYFRVCKFIEECILDVRLKTVWQSKDKNYGHILFKTKLK